MTTYYIATSRHGDQRTYHCDDDCPALDRATGVTTREREDIPEDRACPRCVDPDPEWNQGDDNDWSYQKALAREAGVDSEIVTDGGTLTACPACDSTAIKRRTPQKLDSPAHQTHDWVCLDCDARFDEPVEREPKSQAGLSGTVAALDAADPDAIPDGGETLRSKAEMNTGRLSVAGVVGWPKPEKEYVDLGEELGDELPAPDRTEHERRARQSATSVAAWSRRAGVDPRAVIDEAWAELSRDGDDEGGHYCEICERGFETIARLITHDCEEQDGPLVTDGGEDERPLEALLTAEEDERPDAIAFGDTEIDTDEFVSRLSVIRDVGIKLEVLQEDLEALRRTGLRDGDVVDLLYGRNAGLNKSTIESVMETVDDLDRRLDSSSAREDLLVRLVADLSDETLTETEEVFDELARLNTRYRGDAG
jgi:hypothetical protein